MSNTESEPTSSERPPARHVRRRAGLAAGALLLAGSGIVGGSAIALNQQNDTSRASSSATQTPIDSGHGSLGRSGASAPPNGGSASGTASTPETASDATAAQTVGLVTITSTLTNGNAAGTGLVLTSDGTVVTNHHVVEGATSLKATVVSTGRTYPATYVGGDATADVAVLRLADASGLTPVDVATTAAVEGDSVTAVGDAGGDGGSLTASPGIVTATGQDITVQNDDGSPSNLTDLVEMNAYVVPGHSGGAVLDAAGDLVGMNVAASSGSRDVTGYAIPVLIVTSVVDQIQAGSDTSTVQVGYDGYLGVGLDPSTSAPLVVEAIDGGAAAGAGVAAGDTITSLSGTTVTSADQLRGLLAKTTPGERVTVTWTAATGGKDSATVTLGRAPIA